MPGLRDVAAVPRAPAQCEGGEDRERRQRGRDTASERAGPCERDDAGRQQAAGDAMAPRKTL